MPTSTLLFLLAHLSAAAADGGFDAHGFRLAAGDADPRAPMMFVRPANIEPFQWSLGGVVEYASRPLVFDQDGVRTVALQDLVAFDLAGGFAPIDRVRIDLAMPVYLSSADATTRGGPVPGDLHSSLLIAVLEPDDSGGFGIGLTGALDAPTGTPERWLGTDGPAASFGLATTLELGPIAFSWTAGGRIAPNTDPNQRPAVTRGGDSVEAGVALAGDPGNGLGLGIEAGVSYPLDAAVRTAIGIPAVAVASVRYATDSGGYVMGGFGTGLSLGAGASPIRVVLGGGFGGHVASSPRDSDGDGLEDKVESCPTEAETPNGYRDQDGCPDTLPQVEFVARRGDQDEPAAALTLTRPDGTVAQGIGRMVASGLPGETYKISAKFGACYGGSAEANLPVEGSLLVTVPVARQDAELVVTVTDGVGRPLDGAEVRYLLEDDACAPTDTSISNGKAIHTIGAGPFTIFVTAPGYGVHQATLTLTPGQRELVDAKLAPTQVSLRDGRFRLAKPIVFTSATSANLGDGAYALLGQVASLMQSNDAQRFAVKGFAPTGSSAKRLSQERASAVVAYLTSLGVRADQLDAVGAGAQPSRQQDWVTIEVLSP